MRLPRLFRKNRASKPQGNVLRAPMPEKKPRKAAPTPNLPLGAVGAALRQVGSQLRGGWDLLTGRVSLLQLIQQNLLFTVFLTCIGLVYIWNSHQAERQARAATQLEREIRELKTEYLTLNAQLSISRQQSRVETLVDSLGLEPPERPPVKLEVPRE